MQLNNKIKDLSNYRLEKAKENLKAAVLLETQKLYTESVNRSYYSIFHAIRALTAFYCFDAKKHSSIISFFNLNFIKTGKIDVKFSKIVTKAFKIRTESDYQDFYFVTKSDCIEQIENAEIFIKEIINFINQL